MFLRGSDPPDLISVEFCEVIRVREKCRRLFQSFRRLGGCVSDSVQQRQQLLFVKTLQSISFDNK